MLDTEDALRENEARLAAILNSIHAGVVVIDAETHQILDANPYACDLIGVSKEQCIGQICHKYICPAEQGRCPVTDLGQTIDKSERILLGKDGERIPILKAVTLAWMNGRSCLIETFVDIREHKKVEQATEASRNFLQTILDTLPDPIMVIDRDYRVLQANQACREAAGKDPISACMKCYQVFHAGDQPCRDADHACPLEKAVRTRKAVSVDHVHRTARGKQSYVEVTAVPVFDDKGEVTQIIETCHDVTDRRRSEDRYRGQAEHVRQERANLQAIFNASQVAMLLVTETGQVVQVNEAATRLVRRNVSDFLNRAPGDGVCCLHSLETPGGCGHSPACSHCPIRNSVQHVLGRGGTLRGIQHQMELISDGKPRKIWVELNVTAVTINDRKHVLLALVDITDRQRAEELLRESERKYRTIYENSLVGILRTRANDGLLLECNEYLARLGGYASRAEILAANWHTTDHYVEPQAREKLMAALMNNSLHNCETQLRRRDGAVVSVQVSGHLDREHGYVDAVVTDITDRKKAEEELRKAHERFELAVRGSDAGLFDWDCTTDRVYFSPRWKSLLGYEDAEIGNLFSEWETRLHPDDRERAEATIKDFLQSDSSTFELEHRLRCKDGNYRWILAHGAALRDERGKPYRLTGSHIDITDRKRAEESLRESEEKLRRLIELTSDVVWECDENFVYTYVSEIVQRILGYSPEEVVGKTIYGFAPPAEAERIRSLLETALADRQPFMFMAIVARHKDGHDVVFEASAFPVLDARGVFRGYRGVSRDITERMRAQDELLKAKEVAEAANQAKSQFLANMSHEIRTPMNGIIGMTDLLLDTQLDAEQREFAETIKSSSDALLRVINDVLDFSKVEAGKLDVQTVDFDLPAMVVSAAEAFASQVEVKGLELTCRIEPDVPSWVCGDPWRVRQVLTNLIGNAVKFTKVGGVTVRVSLDGNEDQRSTIRFSVTDTGIGVPKSRQAEIFEAFTQADGSMTREYGGTGLGLTISRSLTELLGGTIGLESEEGKGSTFWFTAVLSKPTGSPPASQVHDGLKGLTVFVVDDNDSARTATVELFGTWHCRVAEAPDGAKALEMMRAAAQAGTPFRLVVIDMRMPGMNGHELGRLIRNDKALGEPVMILLSAAGRRGDADIHREIGFDACLSKPINPVKLYEAAVGAVAPDAVVPSETPKPQPAARPPRDVRILLAEDSVVNQKVALRLLEKHGYRLDIVNNGKEAVQAISAGHYDLVLMDCQMPEMDGFTATGLIRQSEKGRRHTPIVALTAHALQEHRDRCIEAGMDDYLSKPVEATALLNMIEKWIAAAKPSETRAAPAIPQDSVPVFDRAAALARLGDDVEILKEVIVEFLNTNPRQMKEMRAAMESNDLETLRRSSHSLKGISATLGVMKVHEQAKQLEQMAKDSEVAGAPALYAQIETELDRALVCLKSFLTETNG